VSGRTRTSTNLVLRGATAIRLYLAVVVDDHDMGVTHASEATII